MTRAMTLKRPRRRFAFRPLADALETRQLLSAAEFQLNSLLPANGGDGSNGFVVDGVAGRRILQLSGPVGDVNQDGLDDFLICDSRPTDNPNAPDHVHLVFGQAAGFPAEFNHESLDATNSYLLEGAAGMAGSGPIDLNHDGIPDLVLRSASSMTQSVVLFGGEEHLAALDATDGNIDHRIIVNPTALDGTNGFTITGGDAQHSLYTQAGGDINGDHVDDLVLYPYTTGEVYVVFGRDGSAFPPTVNCSTLDGSNGFVVRNFPGDPSYSKVYSAGGCGDVNGDGLSDLVIGMPYAIPSGLSQRGQAFVVFGRTSFPAVVDATTLNGSNGFTIDAIANLDFLGWDVCGAGDVNGDGVEDFCVGAFGLDSGGGLAGPSGSAVGGVCVVFGKQTSTAGAFPSHLNIANLDGTNGFIIRGVAPADSMSLTSQVGDVNRDGYDDLLVATQTSHGSNSGVGEAYLVYGGPNFPSSLDLGSLLSANGGDGSVGYILKAFQPAGSVFITGLGDINGDGYADVGINSPGADLNGGIDAGQAYVVYGKPSPPRPTKFYVVNDGSTDRTYEYTATSIPGENYALNTGNTAPRGAAGTAAGDKVWVVDSNKKVYVYDTSGGLLGSWTAGTLASNATVEGVATNGTDVWIVDAKADKVFRYSNAASRLSGSQNAASSFSLNSGNASPKDIVTDGVNLWVVNDSSTDKVFKYTLSGSLVGSWTITGAGSSPTGITLDPAHVGNLWIVDSGTKRVYQFDNAASLTSGQLYPSTSFALASGNTNPQGVADPPSSATTSGSQTSAFPRGMVANNSFKTPAVLDQAIDTLQSVTQPESALAVVFADPLHPRHHRQG